MRPKCQQLTDLEHSVKLTQINNRFRPVGLNLRLQADDPRFGYEDLENITIRIFRINGLSVTNLTKQRRSDG